MNLTYIISLASIPKWRWHLQVGVYLGLNEMKHVQCLKPKMAFWAQLVLVPRKPFACFILSSLGIPTVQAQNPTHCEHTTLTKLEKWPQSLEDMWMVTTLKFLRLKNRYEEAGKVYSVTSYLFSKYLLSIYTICQMSCQARGYGRNLSLHVFWCKSKNTIAQQTDVGSRPNSAVHWLHDLGHII